MTTVFKLADKVAAFKDKLELWEQRVSQGVFDMFQTLAETLKDSEPDQKFSDLMSSHLRVLRQEFKRCFPSAKDPRTSRNGSVIRLVSNQVIRPYLYDKKTSCWTLQMMVV